MLAFLFLVLVSDCHLWILTTFISDVSSSLTCGFFQTHLKKFKRKVKEIKYLVICDCAVSEKKSGGSLDLYLFRECEGLCRLIDTNEAA